jgi:acetoacetyl-CoA synthetase
MSEAIWRPSPDRVQRANLSRFIARTREELGSRIRGYEDLYRHSLKQPEAFWRSVWDYCGIIGEPGDLVLEGGQLMPGARWFPRAQLNFAENLLRYPLPICIRLPDSLKRGASLRIRPELSSP